MAENDETKNDTNSLIGYDPLAWMDEEPEDDAAINEIFIQDENNDTSDGQNPVHLDAKLNIQNIVKLHEKLKKVLAANDSIEINASDVASIDTATLQLLVALKKDAVKLQKSVIFNSPSPRFIESAKLLGLLEILDV